ncbi:MAG: GNAT family N-acetyltransferase [Candidatus Bathyarchaeota archaeon]|nr:GNAT family N-acetyltransferase [Candidatus Bathyarchaeota archaeon]MDH5780364.1 GNAT family N-acetyltransferase [Candidatus Bathyarchaeota archaeon]
MLEGRTINLRLMEKDDIDSIVEVFRNIHFDEYDPLMLISKSEMTKRFDNPSPIEIVTQNTLFIIEKKDRAKIGLARHFLVQPAGLMEIGYIIVPSERRKGYGTEAAQIMVDYLFLSKEIVRIQATTDAKNKASQRVLEKAGFKREATLRKAGFVRGKWANGYLYSILREEWREPKILTKATSET